MRAYRILYASNYESKNPAKSFSYPCYAFAVVYLTKKFRAGECDIVREANPVDFAQRFQIFILEVAYP
jgi:hypothetical protein